MSSYLTVKSGIYDPSKRFAFKNIQVEGLNEGPFTFTWDNQPITVKAGSEIELPHHMAVVAATRLVDKIMITDAKNDEIKNRKLLKDPNWRSPKGISLGVPEARKVWEDQILRELKLDDENPQVAVMRAQMREEFLRDIQAEKSSTPPSLPISPKEAVKEFEGANVRSKKE